MQHYTTYPGGSKTRVNQAGNNLRNRNWTDEDYCVIDAWRAAHRSVLNTFQSILRTKTKNKEIVVAQRHKRMRTIYDKLCRFPKMQLARMDDVAGCRIIFHSIDELYEFRTQFHKSRFRHRLRNELDKYDYIKIPKETGYRGIHDIYTYDVNSQMGKQLKGLYIEIQYRTLIQHAWATAVEVIGFITESQPKFQKGDDRYITAMAYASEILARAYENRSGPFPELNSTKLLKGFFALDAELSLLEKLRGLRHSRDSVSSKKNTILIISKDGTLETKSFRDAPDALKTLFTLEKSFPDKDIVLVKADKNEDIRIAFRNYFSDATDFIKLLNDGIKWLSHK